MLRLTSMRWVPAVPRACTSADCWTTISHFIALCVQESVLGNSRREQNIPATGACLPGKRTRTRSVGSAEGRLERTASRRSYRDAFACLRTCVASKSARLCLETKEREWHARVITRNVVSFFAHTRANSLSESSFSGDPQRVPFWSDAGRVAYIPAHGG